MCGIVGAASCRHITEVLTEALKRLEYRGYDSAGLAVIYEGQQQRLRVKGKVAELIRELEHSPIQGQVGIAHTRWATHGEPSVSNAHPHMSTDKIAVVHNGIIENHEKLREQLVEKKYTFSSETDSEIIAHLIQDYCERLGDFTQAVHAAKAELNGAFAIAVTHIDYPDTIIALRKGSPLVIGEGLEENFIASDQMALLPFAKKFMYLEEGDIARIRSHRIEIFDSELKPVTREPHHSELSSVTTDKGQFRHYMQKEIFEQPSVIADTLTSSLEDRAIEIIRQAKAVQIVACGTSYHAGLIAKYWIEAYVGIPCMVEIASEFRYRKSVVQPDTLFVTISQSGETADTLAALKLAKSQAYLASLTICNVAMSSLVRESDCVLMTRAGAEIGVASTKAFTTQLTAILILIQAFELPAPVKQNIKDRLTQLPELVAKVLTLDGHICQLAKQFADKQHALFLGRGAQYPVALEGALKLKEISYIHAEAYPAGELKHGPLALVDDSMPVITVAPNDELLEKLKSNLAEVRARGGKLFVFADEAIDIPVAANIILTQLPSVDQLIAPIVYTIPLQLLAYHVAVIRGTDVDQPRNLAKSVTVE